MEENIRKRFLRPVIIVIAATMMAVNIKTFVRTGGLYPGGATGLTILIQTIASRFFNIELPYSVVNILLNLIPVYIGLKYIGKKFTAYSCLMIVLTSVLTDIIPSYPITYDILLIAIFGGLINGLTISICLLAGATTGGTDFISLYLSEKKGIDSWNIIFAINVVILSTAGILFGWDKALYSIIFQYTSTQVLHLLYKRYQKQTLFIITNNPEEVCNAIYDICKHGATILEGEGSHEHIKRDVVYSVVSRADSKKVLRTVREIDPQAFVNSFKTEEISGYFHLDPED